MEYLVLYLAGVVLLFVLEVWLQHRHKQYYKYVVYMTLVLSGAYAFARHVVAGRGYVYVFFLSIAMALFAAYITRTYLGEKPAAANETQ